MSLNVIALGGNAILDKDPSDEGQKQLLRKQHVILPILSKKGKKSLFVTAMDHKSATYCCSKSRGK